MPRHQVIVDQRDGQVAEDGGDEEEGEELQPADHLFEFMADQPDEHQGKGEMPGFIGNEDGGQQPMPLPTLHHRCGIDAEIVLEGIGGFLGEERSQEDERNNDHQPPADSCRTNQIEVGRMRFPEVFTILITHSKVLQQPAGKGVGELHACRPYYIGIAD